MSSPEPICYPSSGGESQLRPYEGGEEFRVELHRQSFSVLWTVDEPSPADFMRRVGALVSTPDSGRASLEPADDDDGDYSFPDAIAELELGSVSARFIRVVFPDGAFTWEAHDTGAAQNGHAAVTGEIGVIWNKRSQLRPDWLRTLIDGTATPQVAADIESILESTEQLTSDFKPVAS